MIKPDCYQCTHLGEILGNAHSCCNHPKAKALVEGLPFAELIRIVGGVGPMKNDIGVVGHPHGIAMGWFAWPLNFDPAWLTSCDGFEPRKGDNDD